MTPQRSAFDRIPALYLSHYRAAYSAIEDQARELGLPAENLSHMLRSAPLLDAAGTVREDDLRGFASYDARGRWAASWDAVSGAGLAERDDRGWRMTSRGQAALERGDAAWSSYIEAQPAPAGAADIVATALHQIVAQTSPDDWRATLFARRIALEPRPSGALAKAIAPARVILGRRDDSHVAAWRAAGYDAAALDALTAVIAGTRTVADTARALESKQDRAQVERSLEALVSRGEVTRDGDVVSVTEQGRASRAAIEAETDRRFFRGWPARDDLAHLDAALAQLPQASPR